MNIILTLAILSVIVIVHEFGHFIAARKCGVLVEEFAIGMGPVLLKRKPGETLFTIRAFPIGGFCKMHGEDGEPAGSSANTDASESDADASPEAVSTPDTERSFFNKPKLKRAIILAAGSLMNFALALVFIFIINMTNGILVPEIASVLDGFPAEAAGLMPGDRITRVNDFPVRIYDDFSFALSEMTDNVFDLTVKRGKDTITVTTQTKLDEESGRYLLGITRSERSGLFKEGVRIGVFEALYAAFFQIVFWIKATIILLVRLIASGIGANALTGPIGLTAVVGSVYEDAAQISIMTVVYSMLNFCAFISVNIGMLNLFPLPAMDGGRLTFLFIETVFRRRVPPEKEALVHLVGLALFIVLAIVIAVNDVRVFYAN